MYIQLRRDEWEFAMKGVGWASLLGRNIWFARDTKQKLYTFVEFPSFRVNTYIRWYAKRASAFSVILSHQYSSQSITLNN